MALASHASRLCVRALGACVAVLLALGQLASLGHLVLVEHTVCAEHGDMHHGDAADAPRDARAAGVALDQGAPSSVLDHEHCDGWVRVPQHVTSAAPAATAPQLLTAPPAPELRATRTFAAPIALLALAPKLAPPRA